MSRQAVPDSYWQVVHAGRDCDGNTLELQEGQVALSQGSEN